MSRDGAHLGYERRASVKVEREARGAGRHFREAEPRPAKQRLRKPAKFSANRNAGFVGFYPADAAKKQRIHI